ncbi:hypothetical protein ABI59_02690 [Acidobacteria bacterium Mor1]|nr:hypothetical protein ABI59_02690 [Acidobacteria bacterium Mor1]
MKGRLMAALVPAGALGALFGAGWWGQKQGFIAENVWFFLWPSLVAVGFLAFSVAAFLMGFRRWLWPLGTGFIVQTVGVLLLASMTFDRPVEPLIYTLVAVGIVLAIMGGVWLTRFLRARWLERHMLAGMDSGGIDPKELERIRNDMVQALEMLRRAGRGRNAIYELPWFLVIGRPAAGKTVAIKNSGLGLPVRKDWTKGVGGTYTCDWFFTNDLIFMDTPGKWVQEGVNEESKAKWEQLLRLLRKYRGRRPMDGLVVLVPADDLLGLSEREIQDQAANIRECIDLLHHELSFRIPVYLLVSKSDLVEGFVDFFRGLPAKRRSEMLGWSNDDPNRQNVGGMVRKGLGRLQRQLEQYRLEMLGNVAAISRSRRLFQFTEEFKRLSSPLSAFAEVLFHQDPSNETPVFRGFYFTSGTQGEGSPIGRAMSDMARNLGIPVQTSSSSSDEPKRSYFLLDLFRDLMVGDEGLVGRTARHWWRQRRNTMIGAFLPAGIAGTLLLLSIVALFWNKGTYSRMQSRVPEIVQTLRSAPDLGTMLESGEGESEIAAELGRRLALTDELRQYHRRLTGFNPFRRFGMRRAGDLADVTFDVFHEQLDRSVLRPTLERAEAMARGAAGESCPERVDVLQSVVWLRMGRRFDSVREDMAGFDRVWGLQNPAAAQDPRDNLRLQFAYLVQRDPSGEPGRLLRGFSISSIVDSIRSDCDLEGSGSALERYGDFQQACLAAASPTELQQCDERLRDALAWEQAEYDRFAENIESLRTDLRELRAEEPEAKTALDALEGMKLSESDTRNCVLQFANEILPDIQNFAMQEEMLQICRDTVGNVANRAAKYAKRNEILGEQEASLETQGEDLKALMANYNIACRGEMPALGFRRLEFETLKAVSFGYRREACIGFREAPAPARQAQAAPAPPRRKAPPRPRRASFAGFEAPRFPSGTYTADGWRARKEEWMARWEGEAGIASGSQQAYKETEIRREIGSYVSSFTANWLRYLDSLALAKRKSGVSEWLQDRGTSPHYKTLLGKPATALAAVSAEAAAPFEDLGPRLEPLRGVSDFADAKLGDYQSRLTEVAGDLAQCEEDPAFYSSYRRSFAAGSGDNSLAQAIKWVEREAGPGLAQGKLKTLLMAPLDEAQSFVLSGDNLSKTLWSELRRIYDGETRALMPFAGDPGAEGLADDETMVALFGGDSGIVSKLGEVSSELGPQASAWFARASEISDALFEKDTDRFKPVRVRLEVDEITFEPEKLGKDQQVGRLWIYLGGDAEMKWDGDELEQAGAPPKSGTFQLFGDDKSDNAFVRAFVAERKGFFKRIIGKDFGDMEPNEMGAEQGAWAPLKTLAAGGGASSGEGGTLRYRTEVQISKKKVGAIDFQLRWTGKDAATLIGLLGDGLASPPAAHTD